MWSVGTGYFQGSLGNVAKDGFLTQSPVSRNRIFTVVVREEPSGANPQNGMFGFIAPVKGR